MTRAAHPDHTAHVTNDVARGPRRITVVAAVSYDPDTDDTDLALIGAWECREVPGHDWTEAVPLAWTVADLTHDEATEIAVLGTEIVQARLDAEVSATAETRADDERHTKNAA